MTVIKKISTVAEEKREELNGYYYSKESPYYEQTTDNTLPDGSTFNNISNRGGKASSVNTKSDKLLPTGTVSDTYATTIETTDGGGVYDRIARRYGENYNIYDSSDAKDYSKNHPGVDTTLKGQFYVDNTGGSQASKLK